MDSMQHSPVSTTVAAKMMGVAASTLENWRSRGNTGPAWLKIGRRVLYDPRDIEAWKAACRVQSTAKQERG